MLDWTDRHCRYFLRQITRHTLLYSEMVTCGAIIHGQRERHLSYHSAEHPLALQLGGSDPSELAQCAVIAQEYGFDEINLNVGCPSDKVQSGRFGACLMATPYLVADCVAAMNAAINTQVTVKSRIGIDDLDSYEALCHFISTVSQAGCQRVIIHARKAWLQGLSPKENREIPPLRYEVVRQLKQDFPHLKIILNGGITTLAATQEHLTQLDGVMIGRAAYHDPYMLSGADQLIYQSDAPIPSRHQIIDRMLPYIEDELAKGQRLHNITRHMLGLFQGCPGARAWRRHLSEHACRPTAGIEVLKQAALRVADFTI